MEAKIPRVQIRLAALLSMIDHGSRFPFSEELNSVLRGKGLFFIGQAFEYQKSTLLEQLPIRMQAMESRERVNAGSSLLQNLESMLSDKAGGLVVLDFKYNYLVYYEIASMSLLGILKSESRLGSKYSEDIEIVAELFKIQYRFGDWYQDGVVVREIRPITNRK